MSPKVLKRFGKVSVIFLMCMVFLTTTLVFYPVPVKAATFNVSDYGAVPDDANDDGSAIRAAVDAAIAGGTGSIVNFASGEYRLGPAPDAWEYNTAGNLEGWTMENQVSGSVSGGTLNLTVSGTDPYIKSPDHLMVNAGYISILYITMKNNTSATSAKIQWIEQVDTTWDTNKSYTFTISANDASYKTYAVPVSLNSNWNNTVRQIRIHPEEGASSGTVNIDYIRLGAESTYTNGKWNYNWDGNLESWVMQNQCLGSVSNGSLHISITGNDPYFYSPDNLAFSNAASVRVSMKNNTADTSARLYYITDDDTVWNESKSVIFPIVANDSNYTTYRIDLYSIAALSGKTIKRIRLDPIDGGTISSGTVDIDYVFLQNENRSDRLKYAIRCDGSSGFTFQGVISGGVPQTLLVITDMLLGAVSLDKNTNITVTGLAVDYLNPPYAQGTISAIDTVNNTFDYVPDTGYSGILDDSRFTSYLSNPRYGSFYGFARDSSNPNIMKTTGGDIIFFTNMIKLNSTTWRFTVSDGSRLGSPELTSDTKFIITPRAYGTHAFTASKNNGVSFNTVNIYASPEAGVILYMNNGSASFTGVNILRKPSSTRWISSNADGFHFQASKNGAVLNGCTLQGCGDDLLNFYTVPTRIAKVISGTKIAVERVDSPGCPEVGDTIQVYDPQTGSIRGTATVSSWDAGSTSNYAVLNLSTAISGMVAGTSYTNCDAVFDLTYDHPNYSISNCTFEDGRRYGLFLKAKTGTVQNCTFNNLAGSAIIAEPEFGSFTEGPAVDTLTVSGCTINNCGFYRKDNYQDPHYAVIKIMGAKLNYALGNGRTQKNITISSTTINSVNAKNGIYIGAADTVTINNNTAINANTGDYTFDGNIAGIKVENSSNITIDGVKVSDIRPELNAGVQIDKSSSSVTFGEFNGVLVASVPNILKTYQASVDFSGTMGRWSYMQFNGSTYSNMTYNSSGGYWNGSATWTRIYNTYQHPDTGYDSVRIWNAPSNGKVTISGGVNLTAAGGNGVIAKIFKNGSTQLWQSTITSTSPVYPTSVSNIDVAQGDTICFLVNNNGDTSTDATAWDPVIDFTGIPEAAVTAQFKASSGFCGVFRNQWSYQYYNGSYNNMTTYNTTDNFWQGTLTYCRITNTGHHPDAGQDSVRVWTAPYSGTISITGNVSVIDSRSNGVQAKIFKNSTQLWSATVSGGGSATPSGVSSVSVNAGDTIKFQVNDNGSLYYDSTSWDPTIILTKN